MKKSTHVFQTWLVTFFLSQANNNLSNMIVYNIFLISYIIFLLYIGTSIPVERVFSGGSDLITKRRSSLNSESIQACMCLKNWIRKSK